MNTLGCRKAYLTHEVKSISELTRIAIRLLLASKPGGSAVEDQLWELREYARSLNTEIERLQRAINPGSAAAITSSA